MLSELFRRVSCYSTPLGRWGQEISRIVDGLVAGGGGGAPVFNWAATSTPWEILTGTTPTITDASVTHTSVTGRVRVTLQFAGQIGAGLTSVGGRLLVDGVEETLRFRALPETSEVSARCVGWWVLDTDGAAHIYAPQITNGGGGSFTIDPGDDNSHYVILSVEDVAAA